VSTARARRSFGFASAYTSRAAIEDFRDNRTGDALAKPGPHPDWERELFEHLKRNAGQRETV
jgi:hypothetical protein